MLDKTKSLNLNATNGYLDVTRSDTLKDRSFTNKTVSEVRGAKELQKSSCTDEPQGICLNLDTDQSKELGQEFLTSPLQVLNRLGLSFEKARCPEIVHEAKKRGDNFAKEIEDSMADFRLNEQAIFQIGNTAKKHFGEDCQVELIPYGLKFIEKMEFSNIDLSGTVTASGTVTFADTDADVDG